MELEYISHSCFLVTTGGTRVVFDPWITGTAYLNQWHLFPKAVDTSSVVNADLVLISHGHEDHLNEESLEQINRNVHIFFPFQWREGVVDYLNHLGFSKITEAVSFRTYNFGNIKITYLGYSLESVIVVESEGKVLVNINDALNSNHETAVDFLLKAIKKRWPRIDYMLSGWSGAGYFPNKVHFKGKNDDEVARLREQYFANNFCRFTHYLQPEIAIPFAPGFVLLDDGNRWINEIKFPRKVLDSYYKDHFDSDSEILFPIMYPGDRIEDKIFLRKSLYHAADDQALYKTIDTVFRKEIEDANKTVWMDDTALNELIAALTMQVNHNRTLYNENVLQDAHFSIQLTDVEVNNFLNVKLQDSAFQVVRDISAKGDDQLIITTKASLLSKNLERAWGGDLLTIGYGIDVTVFEELSLEKNLDIVCVRLISRYPVFREDARKNSLRAMKYYLTNPAITNLWITQKLKLRPYVNKYPFNERDHWITYNKCELCKVCKMPEMDYN